MIKEYTTGDKLVIKKVGKRIVFLRAERNMSQQELADIADLSKTQVCRIERYEFNTSLVTLNRIATALDIDLKELFEF